MFMMDDPKKTASMIISGMTKKTADVEEPVPADAEDAAITALMDAFKSGDKSAARQHMRSYLDIYNTQPDSTQPMPPGSEE